MECRCIQWLKHTSKIYLSHQIEQPFPGNEESHDLLLTIVCMYCVAFGYQRHQRPETLSIFFKKKKSPGNTCDLVSINVISPKFDYIDF